MSQHPHQIALKKEPQQQQNSAAEEFARENEELKEKIVAKSRELEELMATANDKKKKQNDADSKFEELKREIAYLKEKMAHLQWVNCQLMEANNFAIAELCERLYGMNCAIESQFLETTMKNNRLNSQKCGPMLSLFYDGVLLIKSGRKGWNSACAELPVPDYNLNSPMPYLVYYFEVHIHRLKSDKLRIGFCDENLTPGNSNLGNQTNTFALYHKGFKIDRKLEHFQNCFGRFKASDVVGCGLVHSPTDSTLKCFGTCNDRLLGMIDLPANFLNLKLFPAVSLLNQWDEIAANFGQIQWAFNPYQVIEMRSAEKEDTSQ